MKFQFTFPGILLIVVLSFSCDREGRKTEVQMPDSLVNISCQKCFSDTTQSYWIAVPPGIDSLKKLPLIIAFDAHGDGKLAVRSLIGAATGHGYLIAGSNVIRNGYEKMENAFSTMRSDILNRYNVDKERIYAAGFSGGGRFAQIFSQMYPDVRAVISIGAGSVFIPSARPANKLPVLFLAGNEDFNYREINNSGKNLQSMGFRCYVYEFNGKHEWPARQIMDEAVLWFVFDDCRRNMNRKNDPLIKKYNEVIKERADSLAINQDIIRACQEYEKGMAFLSGLVNTKSMSKKIESLKRTKSYRDQLARKQSAQDLETRLQQGYIQALDQKDTVWWGREIRNLNRELNQENDPYLISAFRRIRNFISMASYSYCNEALNANDLKKAARLIGIYRTIDPANPDADYFSALYYSRSGQPELAKEYFMKAVASGFSDFKKASDELTGEIYRAGLSAK
jgi:hypothetical protein